MAIIHTKVLAKCGYKTVQISDQLCGYTRTAKYRHMMIITVILTSGD
jgi:hypothetical protein